MASRVRFRVDLRALQVPREINVDRLRLGIEVVDLPPSFAVSVPGLLDAAEGKVRLCPIVGALTYVMPVSRSVMAWNAPLMSRVYRELESPYFTSLLTRI